MKKIIFILALFVSVVANAATETPTPAPTATITPTPVPVTTTTAIVKAVKTFEAKLAGSPTPERIPVVGVTP